MTRRPSRAQPGLSVEETFHADGLTVAGIDEVGKGAWAGPLVVGIAVVPKHAYGGTVPSEVRDSKTMSEKSREAAFDVVRDWSSAWSTGWATSRECDELGMADAQRLACRRAIESLSVPVDVAIVDGRWDFVSPEIPVVEMRIKADRDCASVAAASVLAKVTRDRHMRELAVHYPYWSFESNKGYPCGLHRAGLHAWGASHEHRTSWAFMDTCVPWAGANRRERRGSQGRLF